MQIREEKRKLIVVPCVKLPARNSSEQNSSVYPDHMWAEHIMAKVERRKMQIWGENLAAIAFLTLLSAHLILVRCSRWFCLTFNLYKPKPDWMTAASKTAWGTRFCSESFQHWIKYTCPVMPCKLSNYSLPLSYFSFTPFVPGKPQESFAFRYPSHHLKALVPQTDQNDDEDLGNIPLDSQDQVWVV